MPRRGGATDPVIAERDEARGIVQELRDSERTTLERIEEINKKRDELRDKMSKHQNDPPALRQLQEDDDKLREQLDRLAPILAGLQRHIAEQQAIAYPPAIGRPPWETGAGRKKKTRKNVIGPLKKGELTSLGYSSSKKAKTRRAALEKAVDRYGPLSTLRKVNAIRVLTKRRSPKVSKTLKADVKYLQKHYFTS